MFVANRRPTLKSTIVNDYMRTTKARQYTPSCREIAFGQVIGLRQIDVGVQEILWSDDAVFIENQGM
jgi:hypothetical protein